MVRLAIIFLITVLLVGCSASEPVAKLPSHHGKTRLQLVAELGEPFLDNKFPMSDARTEFRIELQNTYPLRNPANVDVEIEEMTWRDGDYWITLWLHQVNGQWVVLDSCRWRKDVEF